MKISVAIADDSTGANSNTVSAQGTISPKETSVGKKPRVTPRYISMAATTRTINKIATENKLIDISFSILIW